MMTLENNMTALGTGAGKVEDKKPNHRVNVVKIKEILPHPDPETINLALVKVEGYQVVIRKGDFAVGDLAVYIQPDSVVPQTEPFKFIWEGRMRPDGTVPERGRRITVGKFRGQWSEGLLMPLKAFPLSNLIIGSNGPSFPNEGDDVSDLLGITHYDPDRGTESTGGKTMPSPRISRPKTLKGWVFYGLSKLGFKRAKGHLYTLLKADIPVYDIESLQNHLEDFKDGDQIIVTEKIHGSNARFLFLDGRLWAGSRTQWKSLSDPNIWTKALKDNPWIEQWCRLYPGYTIYGEVVPTQKGFSYGFRGNALFFPFDILTPSGEWLPREYGAWNHPDVWASMAPILYQGTFSLPLMATLVDGKSQVPGANHMREGIVIEHSGRGPHAGKRKLKMVSNTFLSHS